MNSNWIELNLTADEEQLVRAGAALYKTLHLDTIDNVFVIAKAVDILRRRHIGSGVQGSFNDALIQYGFTNRIGDAIDPAIRTHLKALLENEESVRSWWGTVEARKKRDWLSAKAVYTNWKKSLKSGAAPKRPSPYVQMKETNVTLQEQLDKALTEIDTLKSGDANDFFNLDESSPEEIAHAISDRWRGKLARLEKLITVLQKDLDRLREMNKSARPRGKRKKKTAVGRAHM